jgi:hypothetical protein
VCRSRFGFDDEESKVYIVELKWFVALSDDAVPSAVLKAKAEGDAEVAGPISVAVVQRSAPHADRREYFQASR